jgi:hypothetical protein
MSDDPNANVGRPASGRGTSLEDEEKALKKGNTWVLVAGVLAGLAVVAGLVAVLARNDPSAPYRTIGQRVNGMKDEHFDGFWACALPNERLDRLRNNEDLTYAITRRASTTPGAYAQHVRQRCLVKLTEHQPPLQALIAPEDLQAQLSALSTATDDLRAAWNGYLEYLETAESYDDEAARPQLIKIAKGWYDYKRAHGEINTTIREHLNQ